MKTRSWIILLALIFAASNVNAQEVITANPNGSFEQSEITVSGDTTAVEGWTFELQSGAAATFAVVDSVVKDGNRALQINIETAGANEWSIQAINEPFSLIPGNQYTFSVWAKAEDSGTANFTVGNPAYNEFARDGGVSLTNNWQQISFNFTPGTTDTVGRTPLHFSFAANVGGKFWIDSLRVTTEMETINRTEPIAQGKAKWLGNVFSTSQLTGFTQYWNQITPENAGKWGSVESTRDQMNWGELDAAYELAKQNNYPFRFHVLVWGNQQPAWMKSLSTTEQLEEIREWFEAVADRYPDIDYLEVVNEPLHDPPTDQSGEANSGGYIDALGGNGATGWDWIITAFEMAREIFPSTTKLMINEYNVVSSYSITSQYMNIINLLKERGLIDRIGVQAHAFSNGSATSSNTSAQTMKSNLDILAESNLPIWVTELDVDGDPALGDVGSEAAQLANFKRIFPVFWEHTALEGVTLWGWRDGMWRADQDAILFEGGPKNALTWLEQYVDTADVVFEVANYLESESPEEFVLNQNYPNPFNPSTTISYEISTTVETSLTVYNMLGQRMVSLIESQRQTPGEYHVVFDAANLSSGVYYYVLETGSKTQTRSMTLIK